MTKTIIGWKEWCAFPDLNIAAIKAKIDTGATTSALYALDIEPFTYDNGSFIRFNILPVQQRDDIVITCMAPLLEKRIISDSGGHKEERYVIRSRLQLAGQFYDIDLTLADRETMKYRMLLGRNALTGRFMVDPAASFLLGRVTRKTLKQFYSDACSAPTVIL